MNTLFNIIIFSKDRACQLDLLLNSMKRLFKETKGCSISVLYTASSDSYMCGYKILERTYKYINFIKENHFKEDVVSITDPNADYTVFFVDDIVWKERFTIQCKALDIFNRDPDILCLSLRLDPHLNYCYALDMDMDAPLFDKNLTWYWKNEAGDYGYPMSLDGHIYRTEEIAPLLDKLPYKNPNTLEGVLAANPLKARKMLCLDKAPIFNIPINRVQTYNSNRHGNISAKHLNNLFLDGYRISLPPLVGFKNNACHQEVELVLKRQLRRKMWNYFRRNS